MGEVWKARDKKLARDTELVREVTVKVSSAQFSERFQREVRAITQLNHPRSANSMTSHFN
jgi:serine/threonine protein kinase